MWEHEFKIRIQENDFIQKKLDTLCADKPVCIEKSDIYYGKKGIPAFRLRKAVRDGRAVYLVTLKTKKNLRNSEISRETEFSVDSSSEFEHFCFELGFSEIIRKKKKTLLYHWEDWNLEINEIDGLGCFLEAERLSETEIPEEIWEEEIRKLLHLLNLSESSIEMRPYTELLAEAMMRKSDPLVQCRRIEIYSDGGCRPNPGIGAWAYVLLDGEESCAAGGEYETTNNRMELTAAIEALTACRLRNGNESSVRFYIDSQYVQNGITRWMAQWKRKNWHSSGNEPVKNIDLWKKLDLLNQMMNIEWIWIKGHDGNRYNEICDRLCSEKINEIKEKRDSAY